MQIIESRIAHLIQDIVIVQVADSVKNEWQNLFLCLKEDQLWNDYHKPVRVHFAHGDMIWEKSPQVAPIHIIVHLVEGRNKIVNWFLTQNSPTVAFVVRVNQTD